jgi:hypothetical protein
MKKRGLFILSLLIPAFSSLMMAQEVSVTATLDTSRIFIGDQVNYTVTVEQPAGLVLGLKPLKDTLAGSLEILAGPETDTLILPGDRLRYTGRYVVTSFDSGRYEIPPYYAELSDRNGIKRYYSDYSFLEVVRVKIAPQDTSAAIFDIIDPYRAPVTIGELLPWILLAIVTAAAVWGVVLLFRKLRKKKTAPEIIINPDPAHVIAFRELEQLKSEQLWQKGEIKLYYSRLTEILRRYLENRYQVYSLEMTTAETLDVLVKSGFRRDEQYSRLKSVLTGADLVKFAKYKPEPLENDQYYNDAWNFVDATRIREQVVPDSQADGKEVKV